MLKTTSIFKKISEITFPHHYRPGWPVCSIPPTGIIVTPSAIDEFNGPRGDFYKNMFSKCPASRPGTTDEVANVAEPLMLFMSVFQRMLSDKVQCRCLITWQRDWYRHRTEL